MHTFCLRRWRWIYHTKRSPDIPCLAPPRVIFQPHDLEKILYDIKIFMYFHVCNIWSMADCCLHTPGSRPAGMIVKFVIYRFKVKKVQEDTIPKSFCTFFTIQSWLRQTWRPRPRPAPPSQDTEDFNTDYRSCFNESSDNNNTTELVMVTSSWQLVMEADIKKCRKNEKDLCVKFNSHCEKLEKEIRDADGKVPSLYTHAVSNLKESQSEHHCALWVFKWHWTENCWWQRWPIKAYWRCRNIFIFHLQDTEN